MKKLLFLLIGLLLFLAGCASKEEKFLKGEWGVDDNIDTVYDGKNETNYKNGESQGSFPYKIVGVEGDKITVKTYGYDSGGVFYTQYIINESEDTMYLGDYWGESSTGKVISEGTGDEVIERLDNNNEDIIALVFCIVAVIGFIALYYYRNHYKKKKNNDRELL